MIARLALAVLLFAALPAAAQESGPPKGTSELLQRFQVTEARQAVGVDADAFYAVDNTAIAKYDKRTGRLIAKWQGTGETTHLDSATAVDGKLYAAHSNYPGRPMASSIEIWDAATLKHLESHDLATEPGALTWLNRDAKGVWWGAFADYDTVADTRVVRFDADWRVARRWKFPAALLERFGAMSNSGGSWGPDDRLYITGHDAAELYIVELPATGAELKWVGTIPAEISGQGFAFDPSRPGVIYGIVRKTDGNEVTVSRITPPAIR